MSRSIDLFIRSPKPIDEVAPEVARLTGMTFTAGRVPGTCSVEEGGVHAELHSHPYIDDGELLLERYQYALSTRVPEGTRTADSSQASLLRMVSEALRKGGIESLLVHDLQYRDRVGPPASAPDDGAQADPLAEEGAQADPAPRGPATTGPGSSAPVPGEPLRSTSRPFGPASNRVAPGEAS